MKLRDETKGTILVALSGMLYGLIGYLGTKLFNDDFSVEAMLFWRFLVAAIWMLSGSLFSLRTRFANVGSPAALFKITMFGAVTYSCASAFYFQASKHIGTGIAMVIFFSFPVFVTLFAWLSKSWHMNRHALISLIAVMIGLFCLRGSGEASDKIGIIFAVMASLSYAVYVFGSRYTVTNLDSRLMTFFICFASAVVFGVISLVTKTFMFPHNWQSWVYIGTIGILATALPIQLLLDGLKYISPIKASVLSVLEPVVTVLLGFWLLHEHLTLVQSIGVVIVLLGALLIQFERSQERT